MAEQTAIKWEISDGREAKVTVSFRTHKSVFADGDKTEIFDPAINVVGELEGSGVMGYHVNRIDHPQVAGKCGKLGIPEAQMQAIESAIAEYKSRPEWQTKMTQAEATERAAEEYEAHRRKMDRIMGEQG